MRAFYLAIVPWGSRPNTLVLYAKLMAESIHGMNAVGFSKVSELSAVIGLNNFRQIPEVSDRPADEVACRIARLLLIGVDKALPCSFVQNRVLEEVSILVCRVTSSRHTLTIHLPFLTEVRGCVIMLRGIRRFGGRGLFTKAKTLKYAKESARMA